MTRYRKREIVTVLTKALKNMPVVVLSGMRQTGKSTLLLKEPVFRNRKYLNFDDFNIIEAVRRNPEEFLSSDDFISIDEAHKLPSILDYIKRIVDKRRKKGQFLLTGSANFLLLKNIADSLAGRAVYFTLYPFNFREKANTIDKLPALLYFFKYKNFPNRKFTPLRWKDIITGGMPSVCLKEVKSPQIWFKGFEQTYIERDIRSLSQVTDLTAFRNLLRLLAFRNGQILKQSELARDAKLNVMTTSRYLSLLETSFVIFRIYPYLRSRSTRLIKSPKVYLSDSGLAYYLLGIKDMNLSSPFAGRLYENYVAQNLMSIVSSYYPQAQIGYWNIQGRYEVDFVVEIGNKCVAIEVKSSSRWERKDLEGIEAFLNTAPNCIGGILGYTGNEVLKISKNIWVVPLGLLLN